MNKIIIANILSVITFLISIYVNAQINRRKYLIGWFIIGIIESIVYFLLGAYLAALSSAYWGIKNISMVLIHKKEEKIIQSKLEGILFALPFLIIGFITYKHDGYYAIFGGILNFVANLVFIIKKDINRITADLILDFGYIAYDFNYLNIPSVIKYCIEIITHTINIYRLKKNGESKYYSDKQNVYKGDNNNE